MSVSPDAVESRNGLSPGAPLGRAVLGAGFLVALVAFVLLINGGPPYSNWFYAVIAPNVAVSIYSVLQARHQLAFPTVSPAEKTTAMRKASLQGVASGVWFYAFMVTGMGGFFQWPTAIIVGALSGAVCYDRLRHGKRLSSKEFLAVGATVVILLTIAVILKMSTR
jgi:4-hydroxybenzoate polyprenyltransferase